MKQKLAKRTKARINLNWKFLLPPSLCLFLSLSFHLWLDEWQVLHHQKKLRNQKFPSFLPSFNISSRHFFLVLSRLERRNSCPQKMFLYSSSSSSSLSLTFSPDAAFSLLWGLFKRQWKKGSKVQGFPTWAMSFKKEVKAVSLSPVLCAHKEEACMRTSHSKDQSYTPISTLLHYTFLLLFMTLSLEMMTTRGGREE